MTKRNWDRVNAENRMARAVDYSARMDEADERAQLEAVFDAMRQEAQKERRTGTQTIPSPNTPRSTPRLPAVGTAERRDLEAEAAREGITPVQALLRRGHSPGRRGLRTHDGANGLTGTTRAEAKRERDAAEAATLGIPVSQLIERRRLLAAAQMRLHERAEALGISVKELRRRGQAEM